MDRLLEECTALKEAGNRAWKAGDAKAAFSQYGAALVRLRDVNELKDFNAVGGNTPGAQASRRSCRRRRKGPPLFR